MKNIILNLKNKLNLLNDKNKKLNFKLLALKKLLKENEKYHIKQIDKMEKLKNKLKELEKDKNSKEDQIMNFVNKKEKEEEIKLLKKDFNFEAEKEKNLMNIIVMAEDERILQPFI